MGMPLHNTLDMYEVDFNPGVAKTLGNSGVEVEMYEDEEGYPLWYVKEEVKCRHHLHVMKID